MNHGFTEKSTKHSKLCSCLFLATQKPWGANPLGGPTMLYNVLDTIKRIILDLAQRMAPSEDKAADPSVAQQGLCS